MITWKRAVMALPAVGVSLLPKLACPICWPAYAGVLTALGLGFLISEPYLLWVTVTFLMVCMGSLILRAQERRGYGPATFGIIAGAVVLAGKFHFESNAAMYSGLSAGIRRSGHSTRLSS